MPFFNAIVPKDYKKNERLDKYITCVFKDMNRSKLKSGLISLTVNGKNAKLSSKIFSGDEILLEWDETIPNDIVPENIPIDIIYEDKNVTVVNKHQGMVTHPACGNWNGTLVNALLYHWGREAVSAVKDGSEAEILSSRRPGIVHRLDKETCGLMVIAKNPAAASKWIELISSKQVQKEYTAICFNEPIINGKKQESGTISSAVIKKSIKNQKELAAITNFTVEKTKKIEILPDLKNEEDSEQPQEKTLITLSKIHLKLGTGRMHQIRIHLASVNAPICGDDKHGNFKLNKLAKKYLKVKNLLLGSNKITIPQKNGRPKSFEIDLPDYFQF